MRYRHAIVLIYGLGLFDFDADGHARLAAVYRVTSVDEVLANTGFTPRLAAKVETIPAPEHSVVELIRRLDPLRVQEKERSAPRIMRRGFAIA